MSRGLRQVVHNRIILFAIILAAPFVLATVRPKLVEAAIQLIPDPSCCIPNNNLEALNEDYVPGTRYARLTLWLSKQAGSPFDYRNQTIDDVEVGDTEIPLSLSYAGAVVFAGNEAVVSRAKVTKVYDLTGADIATSNPTLLGKLFTLDWRPEPGQKQVGAYRHEGRPFSLNIPGGIQGSGRLDIKVNIKQVIQYAGTGGFQCVNDGPGGIFVSSLDDVEQCPEAATTLSIYIQPTNEPQFQHRAQLKDDGDGSPDGGIVQHGIEYSLYPLVRNQGPDVSTLSPQMLAVVNKNPNKVDRVFGNNGISELTPANIRTEIFNDFKGYSTDNESCNPDGATNSVCWWWGFHNLKVGNNNRGDASFKFKLTDNAKDGDRVCFLPFVRYKSVSKDTYSGAEKCYTVQTNCPAGSEFSGPIASQPDRNGDGRITAADCNTPAEKAYLSVYGNDVVAGGGFGSVCEILNDEAKVESFAESTTVGNTTSWRGASSQFGVSALGSIEGFFSANLRGPEGTDNQPRPPLDLTFGNSANGTDKVTMNEGGFSGHTNCIKDYFANRGNSAVLTGDKTKSTTPIPAGSHQVEYYEGDVLIAGTGITYDGAETNWGSDTNNIPSYRMVVKGNIFINPSVTRLDGIYIAQPDDEGNGGEIVTCAVGHRDFTPPNGACDKQLVINGAFIAKQVRFKRSFGKLADAQSNESPSDSKAAEVFRFSPEAYLSPLQDSVPNRTLPFTKYDYITSLPPIL